jgi:signal transduction histidine kinase/AraC-like DNA-binding protein
MKNTRITYLFALLCLITLNSCESLKEKKTCLVGLSQCMLDDAWRQAMIREMLLEASNYDNIEVVVRNADSNNEQQISQIEELIRMKVDILIISPYESGPVTPVAEKAYRAGIPTIITDRKVNTDLYTTFVGANNYEIGLTAGRYAANYLPNHATVLEIWGLESSSPAQERHQGFMEALSKRSDLTFVRLDGLWRYDSTCVRIARMDLPGSIDFVYAHNDMMAIAAREFFLSRDSVKGKSIHIIGVDAVPNAGLEAVAEGNINASFMYPTGGEQIIRIVMDILEGKPVDKYIPLESAQVDKSSARTLILQNKTILNYQQRIEHQRSSIDQLLNRFQFLRNSLSFISLLTVACILLLIYAFYMNGKIKYRNRELREMNLKEQEQHQKLLALNAEIKEVTAQKLQFFTNVSHELRTPLTLILGPLNKLLTLMKGSPYISDLRLMQRNAARLLRVINQILDFRKLENSKETLKIQSTDIVPFAEEIKTYFESMAASRRIDFRFLPEMKTAMIWIDRDRMEKVLVNLLSNAFKFTPDGGNIEVALSENGEEVFLTVKDNGRGIPPENIPYLFDLFYTENSPSGTGIGLHLVQEYIRMHHGRVTVSSVPGVKTVFAVSLPKGKELFPEDPLPELPRSTLSFEASHPDDTEEKALLAEQYPYRILIVEDDREVLAYLENELQTNFSILTASNGREALSVLQREEVSLVLSDVMMPEMNGFDLCRTIKSELSFCHIPVILLTALSEEHQKTYAITGGADDYIQKPFQTNFVKIKIISLLKERKRLREQLLAKLQDCHLLQTDPGKIENMDDLFLRKFLAQIEEVYADAEYNVEKLSDTLGISRGHLHRKIKDLTGTTPVDYLRNYRLRKAAILLLQKRQPISEIAYGAGFSSPAYFSKCFKTLFGATPKEYQDAR